MMPSLRSLAYILIIELLAVKCDSNTDHLKNLHRLMNKNQLQVTFNVDHSDDVPEYDVTHPYLATSEGKFVSHDLYSSRLARREATSSDEQHFRLRAFGKTLHLNLRENQDLAVPGLMAESYVDGKVKRTPLDPSSHYFGRVMDHPGSIAAISNNNGALSGKISIGDENLFIRPFPRGFFLGTADRSPHFIFKQPNVTFKFDESILEGLDTIRSEDVVALNSRRTSDASQKYYLELALTAEQAIADKYGNDTSDVLLMVANIAAQAYQDPSIGENKIILVVTRLIIIPDDQLNAAGQDLRAMIRALGGWAGRDNPSSDLDPRHYDVIAIMRKSAGGGLASFNNICGRVVTSVISDNGVGSWTTLAHEVAHNLGVGHDVGSGCADGVNIMTTTIGGGIESSKWSNCSKNRFTHLFNQNRYGCLKDAPQASPVPTISPARKGMMPGVAFDLVKQCQMWYSPNAIRCWWYDYSKTCQLYCSTKSNPNGCESMSLALLDGTRCGVRNWCIKSRCVDDGSPYIHGGWSEWSDFTACTVSCGGGIRYRERTCTNPRPQNGGNQCKGDAKSLMEVCNRQACDPPILRHKLCKQRRGDQFSWYRFRNPCALFCRMGWRLIPSGLVPDGTPCDPYQGPDKMDVCIAGSCKHVGCDGKVGSSAKLDRCRVCKGDGTSCERVSGTYTKQFTKADIGKADFDIVQIPTGSINIVITERARTPNLIVLKHANGKFVYRVPTKYRRTIKAAGTTISITGSTRRPNIDKIEIPGPTNEALIVQFVFRNAHNSGIDYVFWKKTVLA